MPKMDTGIRTQQGADLFSRVNHGQTGIHFTKAVFSSVDLTGKSTDDIRQMTDIEPQELVVDQSSTRLQTLDEPVTDQQQNPETVVRAIAVNDPLTADSSGFYVRTFGLYATDDQGNTVLYGVSLDSHPAYMPQFQGQEQRLAFDWDEDTSDKANIQFTNVHTAYVTWWDFQQFSQAIKSGVDSTEATLSTDNASLASSVNSDMSSGSSALSSHSVSMTSFANSMAKSLTGSVNGLPHWNDINWTRDVVAPAAAKNAANSAGASAISQANANMDYNKNSLNGRLAGMPNWDDENWTRGQARNYADSAKSAAQSTAATGDYNVSLNATNYTNQKADSAVNQADANTNANVNDARQQLQGQINANTNSIHSDTLPTKPALSQGDDVSRIFDKGIYPIAWNSYKAKNLPPMYDGSSFGGSGQLWGRLIVDTRGMYTLQKVYDVLGDVIFFRYEHADGTPLKQQWRKLATNFDVSKLQDQIGANNNRENDLQGQINANNGAHNNNESSLRQQLSDTKNLLNGLTLPTQRAIRKSDNANFLLTPGIYPIWQNIGVNFPPMSAGGQWYWGKFVVDNRGNYTVQIVRDAMSDRIFYRYANTGSQGITTEWQTIATMKDEKWTRETVVPSVANSAATVAYNHADSYATSINGQLADKQNQINGLPNWNDENWTRNVVAPNAANNAMNQANAYTNSKVQGVQNTVNDTTLPIMPQVAPNADVNAITANGVYPIGWNSNQAKNLPPMFDGSSYGGGGQLWGKLVVDNRGQYGLQKVYDVLGNTIFYRYDNHGGNPFKAPWKQMATIKVANDENDAQNISSRNPGELVVYPD